MAHEEIGFIGTGAMGLPIAANLLDAGFKLRVYNRTGAKAEPLAAKGARLVRNPAETAVAGGIVVSMVADDAALEAIVLGDDTVASRLSPGGIHMAMATVAPATAHKLARYHRERGSDYVAAPVFGRPDNAAKRQLVVCMAGAQAAKARLRPIAEAVGRVIYDYGEEPGAANVAKLSGNFLIAAALEAMAEALTMAEKSGVDRVKVAEMLGNTLFACPVYQNYGRMVAEKRHLPAGFRLKLGLKDVDLALRTSAEVEAPMPIASLLHDRLLSGMANGRGEMDWSALALGALEDAGLSPKRD
ncbi:MAG: NAD(P)-dependent oxidoreductase [Candidatus Binataceae bacterium]